MANRVLSAQPETPQLPEGLRLIDAVSDATLSGGNHGLSGPLAITPNDVTEKPPAFVWVNPRELLVSEAYQREINKRGTKLIRQIVGGWSWRKFKPPIVVTTHLGYEVIDGQHTATAAATHPQITAIPVMVVSADDEELRAGAFISHNRDRVGVTPMQMFFSSLAAGDETSQTIKQACDRAGVKILRYPPAKGYPVNSTIAIAAMGQLIRRRYAIGAGRVLRILAAANCLTPVSATHIKAVEALLFDAEYKRQSAEEAITAAIRKLGPAADREAAVFAATHGVAIWKALTIVYFREIGRRKRAS